MQIMALSVIVATGDEVVVNIEVDDVIIGGATAGDIADEYVAVGYILFGGLFC